MNHMARPIMMPNGTFTKDELAFTLTSDGLLYGVLSGSL